MKITLYTNCFMSNGEKLMCVSLMVWRSDTDVSAVDVSGYARAKDQLFAKAMAAHDLARSLRDLMTDLGHEVELADVLKSSLTIGDALDEAYANPIL